MSSEWRYRYNSKHDGFNIFYSKKNNVNGQIDELYNFYPRNMTR